MKYSQLLKTAETARKNAYTPYSHFAVGAALLCEDGSVYLGCNIENSSYGCTVCAERVAVFKAVSEGKSKFSAIAIVGAGQNEAANEPCYPCGVCRQVLSEFSKDMDVVLSEETVYKLSELLPKSFEL